MGNTALWTWNNNPDVRHQKCECCKEAMLFDRAAAITYQSKTYHMYCLLNALTEYHTSQGVTSLSVLDESRSNNNLSFWSIAP